jgi:LCP family protein required for cell wall assembly
MPDSDPKIIPRRPERLILPRWALITLGVALVILLIGGVITVVRLARRGRETASSPPDPALPTQSQVFTAPPPTPPGIAGFQVWRGTERVTVLVMGVDERESEHGPWRTDTMLVLSLDPTSQTGAMLSIPRDLWVNIPGEGTDRINTANVHGDVNNYPGGGPALAMDTIEQNLGIHVDHYMVLNFSAFVNFIDTIGCISLDVPESISDPLYPDANYGYDPFYMSAGHYDEVCGQQALKYARTRATFGGDFDRAARQQQVIYAVQDRVLETGHIPALLANAPEIWATAQDGLLTDMTLDEMVALGLLAKDLPDGNIRSEVLDGRYTDTAITSDDRYILMPDMQAINILVQEMFITEAERPGPSLDELAILAAPEEATISVLNGTSREGLAELVGRILVERGLSVTGVGETGQVDYTHTTIYDNSGKPNTARYVAGLLGISDAAIYVTGDTLAPYDIQVVLGNDVLP